MFVGDIAWPSDACLDVQHIFPGLNDAQIIGNLEGAIRTSDICSREVINSYKFNLHTVPSFLGVARSLNIIGFGLANNHIGDYRGGVEPTLNILRRHDFGCFGLKSQPHAEFQMIDGEYLVIGLCSPLTELKGDGSKLQINTFRPHLSLMMIRKLRHQFAEKKIVVFIHWGYELSRYPEPADREWARQAIDSGADYIIGHHPHVVQGIESYKHGLIAYSLGNFLLPQVEFQGRTLRYEDQRVNQQLGLLVGEQPELRWYQYDREKQQVSFISSEPFSASNPRVMKVTPFQDMTDMEYVVWFKKIVMQDFSSRRRAGPVFWSYQGMGQISYVMKMAYVATRRVVRRFAIYFGLHRPYNW